MEWGKDHEKDAIECFNHNTFSRLMSCADDFDEIVLSIISMMDMEILPMDMDLMSMVNYLI